jgi:hypothetical protein
MRTNRSPSQAGAGCGGGDREGGDDDDVVEVVSNKDMLLTPPRRVEDFNNDKEGRDGTGKPQVCSERSLRHAPMKGFVKYLTEDRIEGFDG